MSDNIKHVEVNGKNVTVEYHEPTLGGIKEISKFRGNPDVELAKSCEVMIMIDGQRQTEAWWDRLPESTFREIFLFWLSKRPKNKEGENKNPLG